MSTTNLRTLSVNTICTSIVSLFLFLAGMTGPAIVAQVQTAVPDRIVSDDVKGAGDDFFVSKLEPAEKLLVPGSGADLIAAASYPMSTQAGVALENISTGATQLVAPSTDDNNSSLVNIGFDFWFDGVRFTQFGANGNGFIRLGLAPTGTSFTNSIATTTNAPKIMGYWDDLCTGSDGQVRYKTVGSAPNRKLVVEFFNMKITRNSTCTDAVGNGTFQIWLYETTGVVQFVYGALPAAAAGDTGYTVGLQSGAATNFASVTTNGATVSYTVANNAQLDAIAGGTSYSFTPPVPNGPTGISFNSVTAISLNVAWIDNASNEVGYAVYRSTDGVNFSFIAQTAANATSFSDSELSPSTNYTYRIFAVSEGAQSSAVSEAQTTGGLGNKSSVLAGGNWSSPATWVGGVVPTSSDNVTITGSTVTIDTAASAYALGVGTVASLRDQQNLIPEGDTAVLEFDGGTNRSLTVITNATIGAGSSIRTAAAGTVTGHTLTIGGNLTNNGILDLSTNSGAAGAGLVFNRQTDATFGGTGSTNDIFTLTVNKGTSTANTIELNAANFTVQGASTDSAAAGYLTLTNGIFKISGSFTAAFRTFPTVGYTIPATSGFWLNNPNYTVAGQNGSPTNNGLLRISNGTFNVGTASGNSMGAGAGAQFIIEGGTANFAGRLQTTSAVSYTQSGGTVNVCTVGNTATTACFGLTATTNTFAMTGGSIVLVNPNTNAAPLDYSVSTTAVFTPSAAGTTLQLGNGSTPAASNFRVLGATPRILISSGHTMSVGSGTAGGAIFMRGSSVVNNGAIVIQGTGTSSRFDWASTGPMTYSGTGTFGTAATPFAGVGMSANGGTTTINSPIFINRINVFSGGFVNSGQITLGSGGASTTVIQVGNSTTPTDAGTFDVSPVYNSGSGGHIVLSLRTTTLNRMTGFEINPTRTLATWTVDDNAVGGALTVAGGNISVPGTFNLTNGIVVTGANTITNDGTVARTNAYVRGNLSRNFAATGTYTYHVGDGGYSPVAASVTAGTGSLTVQAVGTAQPNIPNPSKALSRHWKLTGTGVTSDLTFTYLDPVDIPGTATEANFVIMKYDGSFTQPGGSVNAAANTATIAGVTSFSDWTLADPTSLVAPGVLALSSATYSANENAGTLSVTVNRTSGSDGAVTVDYALSGGTAAGGASCTAGIDYVNTGGTVSFANGETSKSFNVTLCGDTDLEADETFNITLSNPTGGASIGSPSSATTTILNDDVAGSPVSVTATAGTTGPTAYNTVKEAFDAINAGTHQGAINVSINSNTTETASAVLNASGGSASYTSVVVRPTAPVTVSGSIVGAIIKLNGADNVTIDGRIGGTGSGRDLTVSNTSATSATAAIWLSSLGAGAGATNNVIRNLELSCGATQNTGTLVTIGILMNGATISTASNGDDNDNNSFIANRIIKSRYGIVTRGNPTNLNLNPTVTDNIVGPESFGTDQIGKVGIFMQADSGAVISRNTVQFVGGAFANTTGGADRIGIALGVESWASAPTTLAGAGYSVTRNNVHDIVEERTFSAVGVLVGVVNGTSPTDNLIANNFISNVIANGTAGDAAIGIGIGAGNGDRVVFNSVRMAGDMDPSVGSTVPSQIPANLRVANTPTNLTIKNNSLYNDMFSSSAPALNTVNIQLPTATFSFGSGALNNNNYYFPTGNTVARTGALGTTSAPTTFFATLANWQAALTPPQDANSIQADPLYVSATDLHLSSGSPNINAGATGTGVFIDIDFQLRDATPDIGADEFNGGVPPANDIAAVSIVTPSPGSTLINGTSTTPQARFTNSGSATQMNVSVQFTITGPGGYSYSNNQSIAAIAPDETVTVTFATAPVFTTAGAYTTTATVLTADSNPGNNSVMAGFNVIDPLGGTVTVGTGGTFTSLTNPGGLFELLNTAGLSGNLTVNVTSDLTAETGTVALNQLSEVGAGGYTVTIKPSGAARVISGTGVTNNGLINLNGADRIVFDGSTSGGTDRSLTITNNQTATSTVFWIKSASASNGANNNTIKNCIINGMATAAAQTTAGILGGSGTTIGGPAEAPNNNNTVTNNHIYRVQNSLYNQGNVGFDQNWTITNNDFGSATEADKNLFRGMLMGNANNFVISGNRVLGVTNFAGTTGANSGIQLAFAVTNGMVVNNRISNVHSSSATGTGAFGMQLSATPTTNITIANNFIWDIQAAGSATVASNGHGITINGAATAGGYKIYHNSINLNTNQASGTTAALNITNAVVAVGAIDLRNNILANTQTAGATRFAVFTAAAANVFSTIDYNDYFAQNVGSLGGTVRPTLADWQAATGQDANSKAVDPLFVSATDLHLQPTSTLLGMGIAGTGITTDIDGQTRDTPPDIGADEVPAGSTPGTVQFSSATYSVSEAGASITLTVTRTAGTAGAISVNYSTTNGTATGGASCTAGIDFVNASGMLNWADGDSASKTFNVTICNDATFEADETFIATLAGATGGASIGTPNPATVTITNDDPAPAGSITVSDVRVFEGNTGGAIAAFTVTYSGVNPALASVQYATANGTAQSGLDYVPVTGTLSFSLGTTLTVNVPIIGKGLKEENETFFLNLSNPVNATLTDGQGVGIIIDEDRAYVSDFDRDLYSDLSVFRPSEGNWYIFNSTGAVGSTIHFGASGDRPVPGDYDGDGLADFAVFRPSDNRWYISSSFNDTVRIVSFGAAGDKPVQADYDGDGKTDIAIFRPSTGQWWINRSSDGTSYVNTFGLSTDVLVPADYDGDFKTDLAVFRNGTWFINRSSDSQVRIINFGIAGDKPVLGDFDGDGSYDLAIYRNGTWWIANSLTGTFSVVVWGMPTDIPVPADYDRDGTTDIAVFRPSTGDWFVIRSSNLTFWGAHWGGNGDIPIPSAYSPQ